MKKSQFAAVGFAIALLSAGVYSSAALTQTSSQELDKPWSRLGVVGKMGYVVRNIDPATVQPELRAGDIIIDTERGGQLIDIEEFQRAMREAPVGSTFKATVLRFDPTAGRLGEHQLLLKTFSYPNNQALSRLGVVGEVGFFIESIDSTVVQPDLSPRDVITFTDVDGQFTNTEKFQQAVRRIPVGSTSKAAVLRIDPATGTFIEREVTLKMFPYPSVTRVTQISLSSQTCPIAPCTWCCATYQNLQGAQCGTSRCETGKTNCYESWGQCKYASCA